MWVRPKDHRLVGKALAEVRERANLTQVELAKRLGKPQSFVSAYEQGQRRVDLLEFLRIMDALRADPRLVFASIVDRRSKH